MLFCVLIANRDDFFIVAARDKTEAFCKALEVFGPNRVLSFCEEVS